MNLLKVLAARLPTSWQQELRRIRCRREIQAGTFMSSEPEFLVLDQVIAAGDWVIDIGANVGHYTKRFSDLVGRHGRVIAIEPVPETFALLAANASLFQHRNVTLLNLAASDRTSAVAMEMPDFDTGLRNYYEARVTTEESPLSVMSLALDSLALDRRIGLIKIDAEGHDPVILRGAQQLLARDHPMLIMETSSAAVVETLERLGYGGEKLSGSPNVMFRWLPRIVRAS